MACPLVHPFNDPSADVALVSSDDIAFKLHKIILSLGSDFFRTMFSLSQPKPLESGEGQTDDSIADAEIDGLPVIRVSEPGEVLCKLFRLCYPLDDPSLKTVDEAAAVLTAALKYELRKPIQMASRRMRELMPTASLRVYAIACRLDLEDEARAAAIVVREKKLQDEYVAELEDISIGAYHRLLYYCETGRDPGGLFFTRRPTKNVSHGKQKPKQPKPGSVTLPEPPLHVPIPAPIQAPPPPTVARYPFDIVNPELVIQASDGISFRLPGSFVKLASPILSDMARDCPTPSTIQIPESSKVVDIILRVCSPVENPVVTDLGVLDSALTAATKYEMKKTIHFLREALVKQVNVPSTDPLLLYAIACRHDMRGFALIAAKRTLRMGLTDALRPEVEATNISAGYLYRLLVYHRHCLDAIRTIFAHDSWIEKDRRSFFFAPCRRLSYNGGLPCWYSRYMAEVGRESWPRPLSAAKEAALLAAFSSTTSCICCIQNSGAVRLIEFTEYLAKTMTRLEDEVRGVWTLNTPLLTIWS